MGIAHSSMHEKGVQKSKTFFSQEVLQKRKECPVVFFKLSVQTAGLPRILATYTDTITRYAWDHTMWWAHHKGRLRHCRKELITLAWLGRTKHLTIEPPNYGGR